jgi:ribulose-5-phosphate 4-epimerase/fuculose-1-phosphate aldolase
MDHDTALRRELAIACRILAAEGMGDDIWGHVSARGSDPGTFWLKGAGLGLDEITEDEVILLDLDGTMLAGDRPRHLEWPIHAEMFRARPDVQAVVHSHAFGTVAFGTTDEPLRPICHEAMRWMPGPPRFTETSDLIDSPALGNAVAARLGQGAGVFLRNHGVVVATSDLRSTTLLAVFLERACRVQLAVMATGVAYRSASDADVESRKEKMGVPASYDALWRYLARKLEPMGTAERADRPS